MTTPREPHGVTAAQAADFWSGIRRAGAELEHQRNLAGKTTKACESCDGCGNMRNGYQDYDGYGAIWREADPCRPCGGAGRFEVPCSPGLEAAAIEREIAGLKARLKDARKRARRNHPPATEETT